jgi:4-aminobutyrate aminotransferase-like enzyme
MSDRKPPEDISQAYGMLRWMIGDLTDTMPAEVREWMAELRAEFAAWVKGDGGQPDWQAYRESMNEICREDGMPSLFEEVQDGGRVGEGQGSPAGGV